MFRSAWLAAIVFAICSTLGYAAGEVRNASNMSQSQRLFDEDALAALERRFALQAPVRKHAKHGLGTADNAGFPVPYERLDVAVEAASIDIAALDIVEQRFFATAQPRAPPRRFER